MSMFALSIGGLIVHSDMRLVAADALGGVAVIAVVLLGNRRRAVVAVPILATVVLIVMAFLAVTSHRSPVLAALTLAFAFAFMFVSWTSASSHRRPGVAGRPPRPA
jgi:hypothetical protein